MFKYLKVLSLIIFAQVHLAALEYEPIQKDIGTLTEWSNRCFKELVEHSKGGMKVGTILKAQEFEQCLKFFIQRSADFLGNKNNWLRLDEPNNHLFETESNLNLTHVGYGIYPPYHPFVQKFVMPVASDVCFVGDLHGSVHSLVRNLWRLVALGRLGNDFKLVNKNQYIIFNGDFVDRGAYGVEVIYTLLRLKLANWDNVFLLRGNHEDIGISTDYGFFEEVQRKYVDQSDNIWNKLILRFYELLPFALYLGSGKDVKNAHRPYFVQCCHGGIETGYAPKQLLNDTTKKIFERIPDVVTVACCHEESHKSNNYSGFNWSDFLQNTQGKISSNTYRGAGYLADPIATRKFLKDNGLKAFFRGHQDRSFGLKMLFDSVNQMDAIEKKLKSLGSFLDKKDYRFGPFHWKYVVAPDDLKNFFVSKYAPIFTFTSAAEGQAVPYDCFGILRTESQYADWRLTPYEYQLEGYSELEKRKNRQAKNHSYLFLKDGEVEVFFFNPEKKYGESNVSASSLAGVDKALCDHAIQNQIKRLEKEVLIGKIARLGKMLKVLKDKLVSLQQNLGDLRHAI